MQTFEKKIELTKTPKTKANKAKYNNNNSKKKKKKKKNHASSEIKQLSNHESVSGIATVKSPIQNIQHRIS